MHSSSNVSGIFNVTLPSRKLISVLLSQGRTEFLRFLSALVFLDSNLNCLTSRSSRSREKLYCCYFFENHSTTNLQTFFLSRMRTYDFLLFFIAASRRWVPMNSRDFLDRNESKRSGPAPYELFLSVCEQLHSISAQTSGVYCGSCEPRHGSNKMLLIEFIPMFQAAKHISHR